MSKARVITLSIVASIPISVVGFVLYFFIFKRLIPTVAPPSRWTMRIDKHLYIFSTHSRCPQSLGRWLL